jgi:hypothetical protein
MVSYVPKLELLTTIFSSISVLLLRLVRAVAATSSFSSMFCSIASILSFVVVKEPSKSFLMPSIMPSQYFLSLNSAISLPSFLDLFQPVVY